MADNKQVLEQTFEGIRDERRLYANTAYRIGTAFLSLLHFVTEVKDDRYLSRLDDDTAQGLITFLRGIKISKLFSFDQNGNIIAHTITSDDYSEDNQRGFAIVQNVDGTYRLCLSEILAWGTASLGSLIVQGDSRFSGSLSSPDFVSGFLDGRGWRIADIPTTNAAGETEHKITAELDNIIVRGTLRIFEMVISQLLGENDNRIFSAMLEVDHYDPETGRVYLDTHEGKMQNPFRPDDCIMVQQYSGAPSSDNQGYITKSYELVIDEVGTDGEGEQMLAWVTFHGFNSTIKDATPEALITKRDTFVRVDNLTDTDRKGIIQMMTVGSDTPYIDIIQGLKTDPDNALKGRLGNLQGIIHPLFGALRGFGEYLQNLYATGDFILRRTGESIDTKILMLQNQFATRFSQTSYEASEEQNYLHNGQFLQATGSTDDALLIDGWQIDEGEDAQFWVDANGMPVMVNRELTTSGNHKVQIDNCEGRNVLHIIGSGISQANALIKQPGTHTEYVQPAADASDTTAASREVQDTLYIMARVYANTACRLTIGFSGCADVAGEVNTLAAQDIQLAATGDWQTLKLEGKWNGTGCFQIQADGNLLIEQVIITDEPLANLAKTVSTQIQQTATNIKLLGENISKVDGKATQLGIDIDAKDKSIRQYVDQQDNALHETISSEIKQTADGVTISVSEVKGLVGTAQSTADKAQKAADNAQGAADKAQTDVNTANSSIAKLQVSVNGISSAVGKAATKNELMEVDTRLATAMDDQKKEFSSDIASVNDYVGLAAQDIRDDYDATITLVQQKSDSWSVAAGAFDEKGNLTNTSGLLVTADGTQLRSAIKEISGKVVEQATIETMISNGISQATITANQIKFEGMVTANEYFKINTDGSMEAKAGKIGCLTINSDGSLKQSGMTIDKDGLIFSKATEDVGWGSGSYYFKINVTSPDKPIADIVGVNCDNGAVRISAWRTVGYTGTPVPFVLDAAAEYYPALKLESGYISNLKTEWYTIEKTTKMTEKEYLSGCTIFLQNTTSIDITLPTDPPNATIYRFIRNGSNVTFYGNGKNIALKGRSDLINNFTSSTAREWITCIYLGYNWFVEYA